MLLEVPGDEKQRRRLEAGGDGLPAGYAARHHGAVHGRDDVGVVEIELGAFHVRLVELDGPFVLVDDVGLVLGLLARDRVLLSQFLIAREIDAVLVEHRLIAQQLAGILIERRLIGARIDLGADLTRPHLGVVVAVNVLNYAGVVGPDDDREHRIDGSGGGRGARNRAARDRHGDVMHRRGAMHGPPCHAAACGKNKQSDPNPAAADTDPAPDGLRPCQLR